MKRMRSVKQALAIILAASMLFSESVGVSAATINTVVDTSEEIVVEDVVEEVQEEDSEGTEDNAEVEDEATDEGEVAEDNGTLEEEEENVESDETEDETEESVEDADEEIADEEIIAEEAVEDEEQVESMFPELDVEVTLSSEQKAIKEDLVDNLKVMENYAPGYNYVPNEVVVLADNEEEAITYAEALNGSLKDFAYGVAVITLNADDKYAEASVMDAVKYSADSNNSIPAVSPNYYRYLDAEFDVETDKSAEIVEEAVEATEEAIEETEEAVEAETEDETTEDVVEGEEDVFYDEAGNVVTVGPEVMADPMRNFGNDKYQWHHNLIGSDLAWTAGYTGKGIKLGVVDTGLITGHEDMDYDTITISNLSTSSTDINGHGTNVAGIIKEKLNNSLGGAGVAPGVSLYVYNVNDSDNSLDSAAILRAVNKGVKDGVDILSLSLGGPEYDVNENATFNAAYECGIAIFVAAGNENTSAIAYPAGYTGCISVGAVNRANKKTEFSNYGGVVFSGPGEDIFTISKASTKAYDSMSGTSQATPCVSAMAAVVLGAAKDNPKLFPDISSHTGKAKVTCLKNAMMRGCIASGLGRGTPHLGKVLKIGTSETAPNAPVASIASGIYASTSANVTLAAPGCTIYYTTDGTNITYRNGVISPTAKTYSGTISVGNANRVLLKVLAVNSANKMASKMATYTYTFRPAVTGISSVTSKTGIYNVVKGGSLAFVADVAPATAFNKAVTWSVVNNPIGVSVTAGGVLRVTAAATASSVKVRATSKEKPAIYKDATVYIKDPSTAIATIVPSKRAVTLYNGKTENITVTATRKDKAVVNLTSTNTVVTTSNKDIATAAFVSNNTLKITGVGAGRATISVYATDGSGKLTTITVTGAQYVTGVSITGPTNKQLATGKSMKLVATVSPATAKNKKVSWALSALPTGAYEATCGVKVAASGVVSATANAVTGYYTAKATALDGSNKSSTFQFYVTNNKINTITLASTAERMFRVKSNGNAAAGKTVKIELNGGTIDNVDVTCNAPGILTAVKSGNYVSLTPTGKATGTAIVSVASTDGTNIKKTIRVTVVNPPSGLRLAASPGRSKYIAYNRMLNLMTAFETSNGKIDALSKRLTWKSSNPSVISVDAAGRAIAKATKGSATITATTTDGSGVSASVELFACAGFNGFLYGEYSFDGYSWGNNKFYRKMIMYQGEQALCRAVPKYTMNGTASCEFNYRVSRVGLGVRPLYMDSNATILVCGNKRGSYKVTVTSADGSPGACVLAVTVQ